MTLRDLHHAPVFEVDVRPHHEGVVVALSGELDLAGTTELVHCAEFSLPDGTSRVTFDLSNVTFVDVAGARALVTATALARHRGHHVVVEPPPPPAARVVNLLGLADGLPLAPTL